MVLLWTACQGLLHNLYQISMSLTLSEIKIQTIDFQWIKNTTKLSHLKRAIRIIEQDGNFYTQLKDACYARMEQIDPTCKRVPVNNYVSPQLKESIEEELKEWESQVNNKTGGKPIIETNLEDYEKYFDNQNVKKDQKKQTEMAERERTKGNEAIKSKDFDQAITYYTNSINFDPKMFHSYGNRALAYLKKKDFTKCLDDCDKALAISPTYAKAYHRKAKALIGLKRKPEAYRCYKEILKIEPQNNEINKELMELREEMSQSQLAQVNSTLISQSQFKKITIEEDSEEEIQQH